MTMTILTLILFAFLTALFVYILIPKRKPKNFPPGPPNLPLWGTYWLFLKEDYYFPNVSTLKMARKYNTDLLGFYLGSLPMVVPMTYDLCKEALTREEFSGRTDTIVTRGRSLGELAGIFFVDGPYWQEQRRFSLRHLRDFGFGRRFQATEDYFEKDVRDLIDLMSSDPKPQDQDVCLKKGHVFMPDVLVAPVLNSVLHMLIGRRFENRELREVTRCILRFLRSTDPTGCALTMTPWLRYIAPDYFGYTAIMEESRRLMDFFKVQLEEHKGNFSDDHHGDFTDVYLSKLEELKREKEENTTFTDFQLLWTLIDYTFPVPVTIGQSLNCVWAFLLNYPETQEKIREEIDRVVGRSRLPNLDDRKDMPYTEAVIREVLRKEPVNPLGIPRRSKQDTTLGGYFIPKDTTIMVNVWSAHHDVKIWGDPHNFRPERFLDKNGNLLKKDYSLPFGAGKRLCAGETFARQLMFLLVSGLLQNFTFKPSGEMPELNKKIWGLVLSMTPFWMEAVPR